MANFKSYLSESDSEREARQSANRSSSDWSRDPFGDVSVDRVPFSLDCIFCGAYSFHLCGGQGAYAHYPWDCSVGLSAHARGECSLYYCSKCRRIFSYRFFLGKRLVEPSGASLGVGKVPQENPVVGGVFARRERSD